MKSKAIVIVVFVLMLSSFVGVSFAQDDSTQPTDRFNQQQNVLRSIITTITEATGLTFEEIMTQLRDGATLEAIIEANGGDVDAIMAEVDAQISEQIDLLFTTEFTFGDRADGFRNRIRDGVVGEIASAVSDATGLDATELMQQMRDGAVLADIITDNGGDVDAIVTTVVNGVTSAINERVESEQITQEQADALLENLEQTVTDWMNGEYDFSDRTDSFRDRVQNSVVSDIVSAVSDATELDASDLLQQLRDGAVLADIITDNGGDVDTIITTVVDGVTSAVNERVESEQITQEQADALLENLEQTVTDWMNGEYDFDNDGRRGGRGNGGNRGN